MPRVTPGNYVPLDVNYARDAAIRRAGPDAELLYVRALAYCKGAKTDGKVPDYDLPVVAVGLRNAQKSATALVKHGLWQVTDEGWRVTSWHKWNRPVKAEEEWHEQQSEHGMKGNHQRWHVDKGVFDPTCEHCPDIDPNRVPDPLPDRVSESHPESGRESPLREGKGSKDLSSAKPPRQDVEALCNLLADLIQGNGSKRPNIGKGWHDAARLMLDRDNRDYDEAERLIRWCQADPFWHANVLSMPTFRDKYDQLRLKASNSNVRPIAANNGKPRIQQWLDR